MSESKSVSESTTLFQMGYLNTYIHFCCFVSCVLWALPPFPPLFLLLEESLMGTHQFQGPLFINLVRNMPFIHLSNLFIHAAHHMIHTIPKHDDADDEKNQVEGKKERKQGEKQKEHHTCLYDSF